MSPLPGQFQLLAQSMSVVRMIIALGVVLALTAALLAALSFVRRRLRDDSVMGPVRDFSLGDLRALHRSGKLTDEEFERAKAKLVSGVQSKLAQETKPSMVEKPIAQELKDV